MDWPVCCVASVGHLTRSTMAFGEAGKHISSLRSTLPEELLRRVSAAAPNVTAAWRAWETVGGSKRASDEFEREFEEDKPAESTMNEQQKEYLRWFYRTENQGKWTFAMLVLAFAALLLGCVLFVMGMMGSRSRKKIAKYKAAALAHKPQMEELQVITKATEAKEMLPVLVAPSPDHRFPTMVMGSPEEAPQAAKNGQLQPGDIVVTWKDGTTGNLFAERGGEADGGEADEERPLEPITEAEVQVEVNMEVGQN